jgi:CelD/BcsL family acetyltransferase involved in cellulose biosynthesis/RimJ/RimL family protein N-acetyltransferase
VSKQFTHRTLSSDGVSTRLVRTLEALETELSKGLLSKWLELMDADPLASVFQGPGWCLSWYRSYFDHYEPIVLLVEAEDRLLGLVPLAVEHSSRRLDFASGSSADYRDIVARAGARRAVVEALVNLFVEGDFVGPLQVGWMDPRSDSPELIKDICIAKNLKSVVRQQPCWRWRPPAPERPSGKKFLNWYQRHGTVEFRRIDNSEQWTAFRDTFYTHHSLRQLQSGRKITFTDQRRRDFYDALFNSPYIQSHVTGFFAADRMVAGHFGVVYRDELFLGPPSIRLEDEARSPAIVLLSWIIQNAQQEGLKEFDFTTGDSEFKKRLGSHCVTVTAIDVYDSRIRYRAVRARQHLVKVLKATVRRGLGDLAWKRTILPFSAMLRWKTLRVRELGVSGSIAAALRTVAALVYERRTGLMLKARPTDLQCVAPRLPDSTQWNVNKNSPEDLLKWSGTSMETRSRITETARGYGKAVGDGRLLHTLLVEDRLAGWGFSHRPSGPAGLSETPGASFSFPRNSASLYDYFIVPEFRGQKLYQALLSHVTAKYFAEGVEEVYIAVLEENEPSRIAIERVGFRTVHRNHYRSTFRRVKLQGESVNDA